MQKLPEEAPPVCRHIHWLAVNNDGVIRFPHQMDDCTWAMITSVLLYSKPWNASVSSQTKKTQETSYAVFISSRLLIIHSANMLYQQVSNFGEVSELCCCYQSLHAGIPPLSLLLFSHTFFSSLPPRPTVSLPSPLRSLSVSVVMCWILSKQILLLWPEPRKIFPEGLTLVFVTHIPCWRIGFFKIVSHCDVAVTFHSAQFLTLYYQSSVVL